MYGMVLYSLSDMQKGIQFGHATDVYGRMYGDTNIDTLNNVMSMFKLQSDHSTNCNGYRALCKMIEDAGDNQYVEWRDVWMTYIILSGGTSNHSLATPGTLQMYMKLLNQLGVRVATFHEPDLNDTMTALAFLVDERVFDDKKYPSPVWMKDFKVDMLGSPEIDFGNYILPPFEDKSEIDAIGGTKNFMLRYMLKGMRLA